MKRHPLFIFAILILSFFHSNIDAQVTGVKYKLLYNIEKDEHDFYIHIVSGTSKSALHRAQFNSVVSFVVPTGTALTVVKRYMPLKNNQTYNGTEPYPWELTNSVYSPPSQPESDFHYLATTTLGTYYNDLYPGDSVRLFSIKAINSINECGKGIRLYENGVDPDAGMPGMNNADFSQGFTIGGGIQDYLGNLPNLNINQSTITAASLQSINVNDKLLSVSASGNGPFIYQWNGPNSFNSSNQNIIIPNIPAALGVYNLTIIDTLQCTYTTNFIIDAGIDSTCRNTTYELSSQWGKGTWSNFNYNPPGAIVINKNNSNADVGFDATANGQYHFIFTDEQGVSYRKFVNIIPHTAIKPVMDEIGYVCVASDPIQLKASPSGGVFYGNSISGDSFSPADAGEGDHLIYYEYQDGFCGSTYDTIIVKNYEPNAGPDQEICAASMHHISGLPLNGRWMNHSGNPAGSSRSNVSPNYEIINFSSIASGIYRFIYSTDNFGKCRDTMEFKVKPLPVITMIENTACLGETIVNNLVANVPGHWASSSTPIAYPVTVNETTASVTAVALGTTIFSFSNTNTGCINHTSTFTVKDNKPITGLYDLCLGDSIQLSSSPNYIWSSSDTNVATIDFTTGKIISKNYGFTVINYSNQLNSCSSSDTLNVVSKPTVEIVDNDTICVGNYATLKSNVRGAWTSSNDEVATVASNIVTAIKPGTSSFILSGIGGCISDPTDELYVFPDPNIVISDNRICEGSTAVLSAGIAGSWKSSNEAVATISGNIVTAHQKGVATLSYTTILGCIDELDLVVEAMPSVSAAFDTVCIGSTNQLTSLTVGSWTNLTPSFVAINNVNKKVSAYAAGTAKLLFTSNNSNCISDTLEITVLPRPTISLTKSELCEGDTLHLFPNNVGQWISNNTSVVTTSNAIAHAVTYGTTQINYIESEVCSSEPLTIEVLNKKYTLSGDNEVCVGKSLRIYGIGANYNANDPFIATIDNNCIITTVSPGTAIINCEAMYNSCASDTTFVIIVQEGPTISLIGDSIICSGETTNLLSSSSGTWKVAPGFSNNIATINNSGYVTGIYKGFTRFVFTRTSDGCQSRPSDLITVLDRPNAFVSGISAVCVNGKAQLMPASGGQWSSSIPAIASINDMAEVMGNVPGSVTLLFTDSITGCVSQPVNFKVNQNTKAEIIGNSTLCLGSYSTLSPSFGGTWKSNNPSIATVNNTGLVTPIDTGEVTFTFISNSGTTCVIDSVTPTLSIIEFVPINLEGDSAICINGTTKVSSEAGAIFYSRNGFAIVDDKGNIIGKSAGKARIYAKIGECVSRDMIIDVKDDINASIVGNDTVCLGETVYLLPNTGGIWSSVLPTIASVNNNGIVITQQRGKLQFLYTDIISNCQSYTLPLNIVDGAMVNFSTLSKICVGQEIKFTASNTGTWKTSDPEIASIDIHGNVIALKQGSCSFTFTDDICSITKSSQVITVHNNPVLNEANTIFLKKGDTYILNYTKPANIVSSNTNIIGGNSQTGKLTAKNTGTVTLYVENNAGCISKIITIVVNPANARLVKGIVYADYNANGIYDGGDLSLPGFQIQEKNVNKYYYTNQFGEYYFTLENDQTDILFDAKYGQWQESQYIVPLQYNGSPIDINRGFLPKINATDKAEASLFTSWLRCSSEVFLHAKTFNRGTFPLKGKMVVKVDQRSPIVYANPNFSFKNNNEYEWHFSDLKPGKDLSPGIKIMVPQTLSTTDSLFFEMYIVNEEGDVLDEKSYGELIRCSYDPNDKMSSPNRGGEEKHILLKEPIDYTIRFQNTGNDTAFYVRIFDELDKNLDPSSILITGSSHDVKVITEGHKVSFVFEDIILPDSSRNFLGSQGYVSFKIKAYDQSLQDYKLNNTAKIVFDFNDAIVTNTVKNTLVEYLPCNHITGSLYQQDSRLIAPAGGQEYHWYDCSTYQLVHTSSEAFYTPQYEQEFYAIIYGQDCRYTTNCVGYIITGLSDEIDDRITFYPNPANDKISIQSLTPIKSVEVFDVTGKSCLKSLNKSEIDVSALHQGYYQIKIETVSGFITRNNFVKNN